MAEQAYQPGPIVVGVDGSVESATATRWALDEARGRKLSVRLVHAYSLPPGYPPSWYPTEGEYDTSGIVAYAKGVIQRALVEAEELAVDVDVTGEAVEGRSARVLLAESTKASLLVLGSRRLGAVAGALLGSVSSAVAARASCPVVVVRGPGGEADQPAPVVVGIDDEHASDEVLEFALEYASRRGLPVRAVLCWNPHPIVRAHRLDGVTEEEFQRAQAALSAAVSAWQGKYPAVTIEQRVVEGQPTATLVEQAAEADLLVVGARGRHALTGTLLGSVGQGVLHHARCPVTVVHTPDQNR
ncbi:universal stress protein [Flindersiella endophytica]